jgi:hypothetical protein
MSEDSRPSHRPIRVRAARSHPAKIGDDPHGQRPVAEVGEPRVRIWRLYMALSRIGFGPTDNGNQLQARAAAKATDKRTTQACAGG